MGVWEEIDHRFLAERGLDIPEDIGKLVKNMSFTESAEYFINRFSLNYSVEEIIAVWNEMAYREYAENIAMKAGVQEYLRCLSRANFKLAIATASELKLVEAVLVRHGLLSLFQTVVTVSQVGKGKGEPDIFLEAARRLEVAPQDCLVFEDCLHGVVGAKQAGMRVWAVYDQYSAHERIAMEELADRYIESFLELEGETNK